MENFFNTTKRGCEKSPYHMTIGIADGHRCI